MDYIELTGYAASAFLIVSFAMKNVVWLRILNSVGAFLFIVYGILKNALPVTITNVLILGLNLYYLTGYWRKKNNS